MITKTTISTNTESGFFRTLFGVKSPRAFFATLLRPLRDRHIKHYKDSYFHLWADLLLLMILIGLVVMIIWFLVWQPKPAFSLQTATTSEMNSGQIETFTISFENQEDEAVINTEISLVYPDNFILDSATPTDIFNKDSRTFSFGNLQKGQKGQISIKGIIRGKPGDHQSIEVIGRYQYKGINKKLLDSLSYTIEGSSLELSLSTPETVYTDTNFAGSVEVKNTSEAAIRDVYISFPHRDFEISNDSDISSEEIYISSLESGEIKKIDFQGISKTAGIKTLVSMTALKINENFIEQKNIAKQISVTEPQLLILAKLFPVAVNSVHPATTLQLEITNLESQEIDNISLKLIPNRSDISIQKLSTKNADVTTQGNTLHFSSLQPRQKEIITADIELLRQLFTINDSVRINIMVTYRLDNQEHTYDLSAGKLVFNSNLSLASGGYYYGPQGDQLGVGPIPPQVDIPTTYWIIWQVNNLGNDIQNMQVTADVPANIVWTDQQSVTSGNLEYSPITRRVLWKIGEVGKGGGNFRASFAVSLVPQLSDIGSVPILLKNIQYSGQDMYTNDRISNNVPEITANIEADKLSSGKGTVVATE